MMPIQETKTNMLTAFVKDAINLRCFIKRERIIAVVGARWLMAYANY